MNKTKIEWCDTVWNPEDAYKYIAGFFDGEGCITFLTIRGKNNFRIRPKADFSQKDNKILYWIKDILQYGWISNSGGASRLIITSYKDLRKFIDTVGKYVIVKKEQINLLKEFLDNFTEKRNLPYREEELKFILEIRDKIKKLNHTGKSKYSAEEVILTSKNNFNLWQEKHGELIKGLSKKYIRKDISKEEINKYLKEGLSIRKIAKLFNVAHTTIMRRIYE
jgi:transposase-like protein